MAAAWERIVVGEEAIGWWTSDLWPNTLVYRRLLAAAGVELSPRQIAVREQLRDAAIDRFGGLGPSVIALPLDGGSEDWRQALAGEVPGCVRSVNVGDIVVAMRDGHSLEDDLAIVVPDVSRTAPFSILSGDGFQGRSYAD